MEEDGRRYRYEASRSVSRSGGQAVRPANETNKSKGLKGKKAKRPNSSCSLSLAPWLPLTLSLPHSLTSSLPHLLRALITHSLTHPPTHSHAELLALGVCGCLSPAALPAPARAQRPARLGLTRRTAAAECGARDGGTSHRIASARPSRGSWRRGG